MLLLHSQDMECLEESDLARRPSGLDACRRAIPERGCRVQYAACAPSLHDNEAYFTNQTVEGVTVLRIWGRKLTFGVASLVCLGLLAAQSSVTAAQAGPSPFVSAWPYVQGAPMNMFNDNGLQFEGMDIEPLAFALPKGVEDFQPALAQSWKVSPNGRDVTVVLRKNDRWSNGQPITAEEIKADWALMGLEGYFAKLQAVNVLGPRTVQFVRLPVPDAFWLKTVLTLAINAPFPYEQAHLLPADAWSLITESEYSGSNPKQVALSKKAGATMAKLALKISALAPKVDISDGPWYLQESNAGEQIWQRNQYFFNNAENHINTVILRNQVNNQVIWNWMMHGQIDYASTAMPLNVKEAALRVPGNHFVNQAINVGAGLEFNEHDYPYNMVQVRQAIAYAIDRPAVQKIGEPVEGTPWKYMTGMADTQSKEWLPTSFLNSLNPYNYNTAKAAKLLESVGFKKQGANWLMPNGKPFTMSIDVEAGFSDYDEAASAIQSELDSFGIATKVYAINTAEYFTQQQDGDYSVSFQFTGGGDMTYPYEAYWVIFVENEGWNQKGIELTRLKMGNIKGSSTVAPRERDIPSQIVVPGLGTVTPAKLTIQLDNNLNRNFDVATIEKLAKTWNYWMPVIPLFNQYQSIVYSTDHYTDFPPVDSYLQNMNNVPMAFMYWAQYGWIRPVQ